MPTGEFRGVTVLSVAGRVKGQRPFVTTCFVLKQVIARPKWAGGGMYYNFEYDTCKYIRKSVQYKY